MTTSGEVRLNHGRRRRSQIVIGLGLVVSVLLLYLTFRKVSIDGVLEELGKVQVSYLFGAVAIRGLMFLVVSVRTQLLVAELGRFKFSDVLRSHLLAFAVNNVIPLRAGDVARVGYLSQRAGVALASCLAVVLTERLLEMFFLMVVLAAILPAAVVDVPIGASFYVIVAILSVAVVTAVVVSRRPELFVKTVVAVSKLAGQRVSQWLERRATTFADGLAGMRRLRSVIAVTVISIVFLALILLNVNLVAKAVGLTLPWYGAVVVVAFISFGLVVPSTPGNVGTYHFFAAASLTALGFGPAEATSFAVVAHAVAVVPFTVIAVPILWPDFVSRRRLEDARRESERDEEE